jgi:hypothetical protein
VSLEEPSGPRNRALASRVSVWPDENSSVVAAIRQRLAYPLVRMVQRVVTDCDHVLCAADPCRDRHSEGLTPVLCVKMRVSAVACV